MDEKNLKFDRSRHAIYTPKARKCVRTLLSMCYSDLQAEEIWEQIQQRYVEFLADEPALGGVKITASIYDPILIFAWYAVAERKPSREVIQDQIFQCFMGAFETLGRVVNLNAPWAMSLAEKAFRRANDLRVREIKHFPDSFRMGCYSYDEESGTVRYSFTQCPNAEFARRHHLKEALPFMCNCDHMAMQRIHAVLIREGTCLTSDRCDYCIVGDKNPLAEKYDLVRDENGLLLSVRKEQAEQGRPAYLGNEFILQEVSDKTHEEGINLNSTKQSR